MDPATAEKAKEVLEDLFQAADEFILYNFREVFSDPDAQKAVLEKFQTHRHVREPKDHESKRFFRMLKLALNAGPHERYRNPRKKRKFRNVSIRENPEKNLIAWEARRKFAIALVFREVFQDPAIKNRREDSDVFEERLLRDQTKLIDPLAAYEPYTIFFRVEPDASVAYELTEGDFTDKEKEHPYKNEFPEIASLYRIKLTGYTSPELKGFPSQKREIIVYAFKGDKSEEDKTQKPTIINYKGNDSIAAKKMRGRAVKDYIRCTFAVENEKDWKILDDMIDTHFASSVNKTETTGAPNGHSSPFYEAHQIELALNNPIANRRYSVEIRTGILKKLITDKCKEHTASHKSYKMKRGIELLEMLCPKEIYPELAEMIERKKEMLDAQKKEFQERSQTKNGNGANWGVPEESVKESAATV